MVTLLIKEDDVRYKSEHELNTESQTDNLIKVPEVILSSLTLKQNQIQTAQC
jgi:hypothetical protein